MPIYVNHFGSTRSAATLLSIHRFRVLEIELAQEILLFWNWNRLSMGAATFSPNPTVSLRVMRNDRKIYTSNEQRHKES